MINIAEQRLGTSEAHQGRLDEPCRAICRCLLLATPNFACSKIPVVPRHAGQSGCEANSALVQNTANGWEGGDSISSSL